MNGRKIGEIVFITELPVNLNIAKDGEKHILIIKCEMSKKENVKLIMDAALAEKTIWAKIAFNDPFKASLRLKEVGLYE